MLKSSLLCLLLLFTYSKAKTMPTFLGETIQLPDPKTTGGMPIHETMNRRASSRDFVPGTDLTNEQLSQLLWVAYGARADGHRSAASSHGIYPFDIYVFISTGVYKYLHEKNQLELVTERDFRAITGNDVYVPDASVNIVLVGVLERESYISDPKVRKWSCDMDAGHTAMHMLNYATNEGLKSVPRLNFAEGAILEVLSLSSADYYIPLAVSIGK